MNIKTTPLLLIGCGKMGEALLQGWLANGVAAQDIHIVSPSLVRPNHRGCNAYTTPDQLPDDLIPAVTVFGIKPQIMDSMLPLYQKIVSSSLLISIAAGKTLNYFRSYYGNDCRIMRVMPNTPSAVGRGMSSIVAYEKATPEEKTITENLMRAVGETVWLDHEKQMNAATALAGSGPAYVFYLIETMIAAGVKNGLPEETAQKLAHVTVCGSGELAWQSSESASTLRQNVTSPGGVTAEALTVLMNQKTGLSPLMLKAVNANIARSEEIEKGQ